VQHLLRALDNQSVVGREAAETLGEVVKRGGPAANDAAEGLRSRVYDPPGPTFEQNTGGGPASHRAADGLSSLYGTPAFRPDDYRTLLHGAGFGDGSKARETLTQAAKSGDAAALADLRGAIRGQGGIDDRSRDLAARILSDAGQIGPEDIRALEKTATNTGGRYSVDALRKLAVGDKPSPEALDALGRIAESKSDARGPAASAFQDAYAAASEESRSKHSVQMLGMDGGRPEQVKDAIRLAGARAAGGDTAAVQALEARYAGEGPKGFGGAIAGQLRDATMKGNNEAADALGRMARLPDARQAGMAADALRGAAVSGNQRSTEALASLAGSDKPEERARALPALGDVAAAARKDSAQSQTALAALRGALARPGAGDERGTKGGAYEAAQQLARAADKLSPKDTAALLDAVDPARKDVASEALNALADATTRLPPGKERDDLVSQVRSKIADRAKDLGWLDAGAVSKLVGADPKNPESQATLKKLLEESGDPSVRRIASSALSQPGVFEGLDDKTKSMVVEGVGASGDVQASRSLLARNPQWANGPMSEAKMEKIADDYNKLLSDRIQKADKNSPLGKFGRLMAARQMAYDIHNPDPKKQKLAWNIDLPNVEKDLKELVQSKPFLDECEKVRQDVIKDYKGVGADQEKYLLGDDFQKRMAVTPESERGNLVQREIAKLASVDPAAAERVHAKLMADAAEANVGELAREIRRKPGGEDAHATALDQLSGGKLGAKAAKNLSKALAEVEKGLAKGGSLGTKLLRNVQAEIRQIETAADKGLISKAEALERKGVWQKVGGFVADMDKNGKLSALSTGASLACLGYDLYENGMPKGLSDLRTWSALKDVTSALGSADSLSKLFVKGGVTDATRFGRAIKAMRVLGPIADGGGAVIDGIKAYKSATEADAGRTVGYGVSAAGGTASAIAGVAILAGASGPAAPITLIAGTAAIVGGMLINHFFGDSDAEKFLKEMGRDYGDSNHRYIYPYMGGPDRRVRETVNGEMPPLIR